MRLNRRKRKRGFTLIEVLAAAAIVTGVSSKSYKNVHDRAAAMKCQHNLRQIGMILMTSGPLPKAAFYPKGDPMKDPKSIRVLLSKKVPGEMFVCPAAPPELAKKGLTFLWNDKLNGRSMMGVRKTWVLIEMNCLGKPAVAPHMGKYHVLYTDGSVATVTQPPKEIMDALTKASKKKQ